MKKRDYYLIDYEAHWDLARTKNGVHDIRSRFYGTLQRPTLD